MIIPDNCIDCPNHMVFADPDPHDWFCDDDKQVVCIKAKKKITDACRPYNLRKECNRPEWCPLKQSIIDQLNKLN